MDSGAESDVSPACLVPLRAEESEEIRLPPRRLAERSDGGYGRWIASRGLRRGGREGQAGERHDGANPLSRWSPGPLGPLATRLLAGTQCAPVSCPFNSACRARRRLPVRSPKTSRIFPTGGAASPSALTLRNDPPAPRTTGAPGSFEARSTMPSDTARKDFIRE